MAYNCKVIFYNNELQINKYNYGISVSENHYKSREEIEESLEDGTIDFTDSEQCSRIASTDFVDRGKANQIRSLRRSMQSIYEIARSNSFDYFATFTFSQSYRYDYDTCKEKFVKWLKNFKARKCSNIEWLCVPEQHKDGAWHFHAMIKGDMSEYLVAGVHVGRYIIPSYRFGINEVEPIRDSNRCASYITKYITKELALCLKNKRRYFYSAGLKKPVSKEFYLADDADIYDFIAGNFPEYMLTYNKIVETHGYRVNYIQLAKRDVDRADA